MITAALVWAATAVGADLTASLRVADRQDSGVFPYRTAALSIDNPASEAIETILLRPCGGGPAVRYPLAVPPGGKGRTSVALPAFAPVQDYEVTALDGTGQLIGRASAALTWPAELVTADAFVDDAYAQWRGERASWPQRSRRDALLLLAGFAAVAAAALFVRSRFARAGVVCLAAVAAAALAGAYVLDGSGAVHATQYHLVLHPSGGPARVESFTVLSARRTTRNSWRTSSLPHPVYPDRAAAARDEAGEVSRRGLWGAGVLVDPPDKRITLTLRPGVVRIIRPASRKIRLSPAASSGTVRWDSSNGKHMIVEADFLHQRAVLARNDSVWPVPPGFGRLRLSVPADESQSIWGLTTRPQVWKLDGREARLFAYWRDKHRRADKTYLVNFGASIDGGSGRRMDVLELVPPNPD